MFLSRVRIENIKCFSEIELILTQNSNQPSRWVTLLGENGVGKSTILQAMALLLAGPEAAKELQPRPTGWVRDPLKVGKLSATFIQEEGDAGTLPKDGVCPDFSVYLLRHR